MLVGKKSILKKEAKKTYFQLGNKQIEAKQAFRRIKKKVIKIMIFIWLIVVGIIVINKL